MEWGLRHLTEHTVDRGVRYEIGRPCAMLEIERSRDDLSRRLWNTGSTLMPGAVSCSSWASKARLARIQHHSVFPVGGQNTAQHEDWASTVVVAAVEYTDAYVYIMFVC